MGVSKRSVHFLVVAHCLLLICFAVRTVFPKGIEAPLDSKDPLRPPLGRPFLQSPPASANRPASAVPLTPPRPIKSFRTCLAKTGVDISYPSNNTWWYDSQSYIIIAVKRPIAVAYAETTSDVQALVKCATSRKIRINPRSGGHSFETFNNEDDHFVIDVSRIFSVRISDDNETATVGAGIRLARLAYELAERKRVFPCSPDTSIGLGGHVASGGTGFLMRKWGLSADNVLELQMVDYRGRVLVANNETNQDLFFALRGGGGGSYGIVTQMKLRIYPYPKLTTAFNILWNQQIKTSDFSKVWYKWQPWDSMPPEMQFYIQLGNTSSMKGLYFKDDGPAGLQRILNGSGLLGLAQEENLTYKYYSSADLLEARAWLDNDNVHYGNPNLDYQIYNIPSFGFKSVDLAPFPSPVPPTWAPIQNDTRVNATHTDLTHVGNIGPIFYQDPWRMTRSYTKNTNMIFINELDEKAYAALDAYIHQDGGKTAFMPYGGTINTTPEDFNGFPHRRQKFYVEFFTPYVATNSCNNADVTKQKTASGKILTALEPYTNGRSYQGNADMFWTADPKIYMPRYYGGNVKRLVKAKATYDPQNFFSNRQSTPTTY